MSYTKTIATALLMVITFASTPALAGTQDDVAACRAAMDRQSNIDMDDYRLRFEKQKGFRVRTVHIKAIPLKKSYGKTFTFTCELNRDQVTALNTNTATLFAKN